MIPRSVVSALVAGLGTLMEQMQIVEVVCILVMMEVKMIFQLMQVIQGQILQQMPMHP